MMGNASWGMMGDLAGELWETLQGNYGKCFPENVFKRWKRISSFFPVKELPSGDVLPLLPLMAVKKRRRMS